MSNNELELMFPDACSLSRGWEVQLYCDLKIGKILGSPMNKEWHVV